MKKNMSTLLFCILILNLLIACQENVTYSNKIQVAVSITPQESFVKAIAGDLVDVITLIPSGASPANYQPTIKQMSMLSEAKIYFSIGVPTEKANIKPRIKDLNKNIKVVELEEIVDKAYPVLYLKGESNHSQVSRDPHIWMSPKRAIVMIEAIRNELIDLDNKNKAIYEENAADYIKKIRLIDKEIKQTIKNLDNKTLIAIHPSMGYFVKDYGLEMITVEENGKNSTALGLQSVIDFALENGINTILYQAEFDDAQAKILASEIKGRVMEISPLSPYYLNNLASINEMLKEVLK